MNKQTQEKAETKERIICAANHYKDGRRHSFQPKNIDTGFVICGHRHHNCIFIFSMIAESMPKKESIWLRQNHEQGFLTSFNRFVDRFEAANIAINSGQVQSIPHPNIGLFSEDLY